MSNILADMRGLSSAEDFFEYLALPFDPSVLQVTRLHVLKRFNNYLEAGKPEFKDLDTAAQIQACRALLLRAYEDFIRSTPAREKVFKVFQNAEGVQVGLESLRRSLPSRNAS